MPALLAAPPVAASGSTDLAAPAVLLSTLNTLLVLSDTAELAYVEENRTALHAVLRPIYDKLVWWVDVFSFEDALLTLCAQRQTGP